MFDLAGLAIAINPKGGIETRADTVLHNNLIPAITTLKRLPTIPSTTINDKPDILVPAPSSHS